MTSRAKPRNPALSIAWTRRDLLVGCAAWILTTPASVLAAQSSNRPLVGALRWDAWYVPGSEVTSAVERSLSPPQYQSRMPFFARRETGDHLALPSMSPNLMEREIEQAAYA